jgi:hypothetical protein
MDSDYVQFHGAVDDEKALDEYETWFCVMGGWGNISVTKANMHHRSNRTGTRSGSLPRLRAITSSSDL